MSDTQSRIREAQGHASAGRYDEALEILRGLYREDADNVEVLFLCGACFYKKDAVDKARTAWESCLRLDPGHARAATWLGKLDTALGESAPGVAVAASTASSRAPAKTPPPAKKNQEKKTERNYSKVIWVSASVVGVLLVVVLFADMISNPGSYPFLRDLTISQDEDVAEHATEEVAENEQFGTSSPDASADPAVSSPPDEGEYANEGEYEDEFAGEGDYANEDAYSYEGEYDEFSDLPPYGPPEVGMFRTILGLILMVLALIVGLVSGVWFLVVTFREGIFWFIGCLCFWPVALIFVLNYWSEAKFPVYGNILSWILFALGSAIGGM